MKSIINYIYIYIYYTVTFVILDSLNPKALQVTWAAASLKPSLQTVFHLKSLSQIVSLLNVAVPLLLLLTKATSPTVLHKVTSLPSIEIGIKLYLSYFINYTYVDM